MRAVRKLQEKMYYSLAGKKVKIYERDENGKILVYKSGNVEIPMEARTVIGYGKPVEMQARNISYEGGEAIAQEYGLSVSDFDISFTAPKGLYPIKETSLIWLNSEPKYRTDEPEVIDESSADFRIVAVKPSLNITRYLAKKVTK